MTDQLRKVTQDGQRAIKRRKQAEKGIDILTMMGAELKSVKEIGGFRITASNVIPKLKRGRVESPPGLVVSCSTFYGTRLVEFDWFKGVADSSKESKTLDYLLKYYTETGSGAGSSFISLIDGQPEEQIIEAFPYMNTTGTQALRNGSYYNLYPGGYMSPDSYQHPDDWPHCGLMPSPIENFWVTFAATDLIYQQSFNASVNHETFSVGYNSDGGKLGGRRSLFEQVLWSLRPTAITFNLPFDKIFSTLRPVTFVYYPFQGGSRYYATYLKRLEGVLAYERILLASILPDPSSVPETHTGDVMPDPLRGYVLTDEQCSCRAHGFYAFSPLPDRKPILLNVIDLTNSDAMGFNGPDVEWFEDNPTQRKWKLSVHWNDLETGETWSFTAAQFWSLLESKAINSTLGSDWETALLGIPPTSEGWHAAKNVLWQFFGRPNHDFAIPHDTVTFYAEDNDVYTWTRNYGTVKFTRTGIEAVDPLDCAVPAMASSTPGVRPTIRYSGIFLDDLQEERGHYICVCENLEEPKQVYGVFSGSPFLETGWTQLPGLKEEEPGHLSHVRVVYQKQEEDGSDSIMLLGIVRRLEIIEEVETLFYFTAHLVYNSEKESNWFIGGKITGVDPIDPSYGERVSWDLCLFGDILLSPLMGKYLSPPPAMSQTPCGPYDGYTSGLP